MKLPLNALVDTVIRRKKRSIIPLISQLLEKAPSIEGAHRESVIAKLRGTGFSLIEDDIDLLLSFDPKSCTIPNEYCDSNCNECFYNPLKVLLEPYMIGDVTFIITRQDMIAALLDSIELLIKACKTYTGKEYD